MNEPKRKAEDYLIIAADYDPRVLGPNNRPIGVRGVYEKVIKLATMLAGMGITIKVNSILRAVGQALIQELHALGLEVFTDWKLNDIPETMKLDGAMLVEILPKLVTAMAATDVAGMRALREGLGNARTEILAVTALTTFDDARAKAVYVSDRNTTVIRLAKLAEEAGMDGIVCSAKELPVLRSEGIMLPATVAAIRPRCLLVAGDDQKNIVTPEDAIKLGVHHMVVGRPITQSADPRSAVLRTLEEISAALAA